MDTDKRVKAEEKRLYTVYDRIPENEMKVLEGLITQAARLRIRLDDLWNDIQENGETEMFTQSPRSAPYERERPAARLFCASDKNYRATIKQLDDVLQRYGITGSSKLSALLENFDEDN